MQKHTIPSEPGCAEAARPSFLFPWNKVRVLVTTET